MGVGVLFHPGFGYTKDFFWVVFPDLVVGYNRYTDIFKYRLLVPVFAHTVAVDSAGSMVAGI